jgi:hypothetical protein
VRCRWDHTTWNGTAFVGPPMNMLLTYHIAGRLNGFSDTDMQNSFASALSSLSAVCAIDFVPTATPNNANILYNVGDIDSPGDTLAWCELPCGPDSPESTMKCLVDNSEPWVDSVQPSNGQMDIVRVVAHETGHGVGLEHGPQGALLAPYYDPSIRVPQQWDITELQKRYGPHQVESPTDPSQPPPGPSVEQQMIINIGTQVWKGVGRRVA